MGPHSHSALCFKGLNLQTSPGATHFQVDTSHTVLMKLLYSLRDSESLSSCHPLEQTPCFSVIRRRQPLAFLADLSSNWSVSWRMQLKLPTLGSFSHCSVWVSNSPTRPKRGPFTGPSKNSVKCFPWLWPADHRVISKTLTTAFNFLFCGMRLSPQANSGLFSLHNHFLYIIIILLMCHLDISRKASLFGPTGRTNCLKESPQLWRQGGGSLL